ncbi:MAG: helix-turn-helix transcriptional regulator [Treponema sp.]|jgi:hypothetical protein|nr:helix-turn-helix transcriptional regulator [Treponema sp.]
MTDTTENGTSWIFTPDLGKELSVDAESDFFNDPMVFKTILENIQDGVSIIDKKLRIKYMNTTMRYIYKDEKNALGKKCYRVYHSRNSPCIDCPTLISMEEKKPSQHILQYDRKGQERNWHQLFTIPVINRKNEVILIVEYIRDITFQSRVIDQLKELKRRFENLEHRNQVLADIMTQQLQYRDEMERRINTNMERFIKPSLEYLKKIADEKNVELISDLIDKIIYPITKKRDSFFMNLSSREMQVANLIKEGKTSKEIAVGLCITQKAVDFHRLNIRKKLKINHGLSLRTFLEIHL